MISDLEGFETVDSLTRAKVGWPDLALAATMNFPMYPVPPMMRILLFSDIVSFSDQSPARNVDLEKASKQ